MSKDSQRGVSRVRVQEGIGGGSLLGRKETGC